MTSPFCLSRRRFLRDQPHEYEGVKLPDRDIAICDMAIFKNSNDIATSTALEILLGVQVDKQVLVADIDRNDWVGKGRLSSSARSSVRGCGRGPSSPALSRPSWTTYQKREAEAQGKP